MIVVWTSLFFLFQFLRFYGLGEFGAIEVEEGFFAKLLSPNHLFPLGALTGTLYALIELSLEQPFFRRQSYGYILLFKTFLYWVLVTVLVIIATYLLSRRTDGFLDWPQTKAALGSKSYFVLLVFFFIGSALITFIRQANRKFGKGILWKMLTGTYHQPREEERIFMFLDLRSSTTIAEELGHVKYSRLLQDCFRHLTRPILNNRGKIYQYVGDGVILYWQINAGSKNCASLRLFFDFQKRLESKRQQYLKRYGLVPEFKAGHHMGRVSVAEVGVLKREIAYHGDVVNTTARIQDQCNILGQNLLISRVLYNRLENCRPDYVPIELGTAALPGKEEPIELIGVQALN